MRSETEVGILMRHALNELELSGIVYLDLNKNEIIWALDFLDNIKGVRWASGDLPSTYSSYWEDNLKRFLIMDKRRNILFNEDGVVLTFHSGPLSPSEKPFQGYAKNRTEHNFRRHA